MADVSAPTQSLIRIAADDDVAVATRAIAAGERLEVAGQTVTAREAIGKGHKIAVRAIKAGADVRKYGYAIGRARCDIELGAHVHTHNVATRLSGVERYDFQPQSQSQTNTRSASREFMGYKRANGRVGTRNEIWILCTVGCVARTAERIAAKANELYTGRVDGVHAFTHPFGCSQLGDDLDKTRHVLASLAAHPNAGGVLLIGLGCESNQLDALIAELPAAERAHIRSFAAQQVEDEVEEGLQAVEALVRIAENTRREPCPASALVIGLKCGGSDGFSGLTANPLVGRIADRVADAGGTPILTEIPEIFGAEHLLMERALDRGVFDGIGAIVNDFKRYFLDHDQPVSENPSPGNIAGGITTLEEKSLGAVQKAGHATVTQVLRYGEQTKRTGLALLEAPGNDAVSSTALVASGATVVLFTTGRGTPLGFPAPTLKISSNSALAQAKPKWIDYDAGTLLSGKPLDEAADELMQLVLDTASGKPARNEINDEREIAIWKGGVTL